MNDLSGWLWLMVDVGAVLVFAGALIYGIVMWRNRSKDWATKQTQDKVTRENYRRGG
jgi:hypothetical protein